MAYFPNGSSGEVLELQCGRCPLGEGACPIVGIQLLYNYDQLEVGQEKLRDAMSMLVDDAGICQVHKQLMENITVVEAAPHWEFGKASSNGMPVPTCSKCGWAINGDLEEHEAKCWRNAIPPNGTN